MEQPTETQAASAVADHKATQRKNVIVLAVAAVLLVVGGWLVNQLLENRRIQNCIEARHRNCVPLDLPDRQ